MNTKDALINYCLRIADNNLILAQRLAEWCSRGPYLEEDLAMTNISLDLFGQAETLYDYVATLKGGGSTADSLAFLRTERQYYNNLLVEQPNGDFAFTMMKQFFYAVFAKNLYEALGNSNDETLQGFAKKAIKEIKYHYRHSSEWVIRFGRGTAESKRRAQFALDELWRYTGDMFLMNEVDDELISVGIAANLNDIAGKWHFNVMEILNEAGLELNPSDNVIEGGSNGIHTEYLGHILTEMQYLQRANPGASW